MTCRAHRTSRRLSHSLGGRSTDSIMTVLTPEASTSIVLKVGSAQDSCVWVRTPSR